MSTNTPNLKQIGGGHCKTLVDLTWNDPYARVDIFNCDTLKLWGAQESATCACGHITQSVQHVVVDCMIHKAPDGFAGLRCPDAATRSWLEDLNIEI